MGKIRHIAIRTNEQEKLRDFYMKTFDMHQVHKEGTGRAIYLSDGYLNLAILPGVPGKRDRIDHFGFAVDDMDDAGRKAAENGGSSKMAARPRDGRFAEYRIADPAGIGIDLSEGGWKV
jgi:catechol 2,3-dioxygenase-like lactoylglutathione lyase family enzyme